MLPFSFAISEIKVPNYDFSYNSLNLFMPGQTNSTLLKNNFFTSTMYEDNAQLKIWKHKFIKKNYSLDIYTQVKDDIILNTYVRLPQYFSHDQFLLELHKLFKKQNQYKRENASALYLWENAKGNKIIYQASCSITCFPMFIEIMDPKNNEQSFYQKFNAALPK